MSESSISFKPLGGLGEIGGNCTQVVTKETSFLIDYGIIFPKNNAFGVDYKIPSFEHFESSPPEFIIITHIHEDHFGAIKHLIQKVPDIKIYCSNIAAIHFKNKINNFKNVEIFSSYDKITIDNRWNFTVYPVNHSTAEVFALLIENKEKCFFFCTDFKVDPGQEFEEKFDLDKLEEDTKKYQERYLFCDSTNALVPGKTPSENDLLPELENQFKGVKGNLFITFFPSNIHRLHNFMQLAQKHKKNVVMLGASVAYYYELGKKAGIIKVTDKPKYNTYLPEMNNAVFLISGCQGNFSSCLYNIVYNNYLGIQFKKEDLFLYSAKSIPGNEIDVQRIFNKLASKGVEIFTSKDGLIHCSGHPGLADIDLLVNKFQPHHFIPIHGETFFLERIKRHIEKNHKINTILIHNEEKLLVDKNYKIVKDDPLGLISFSRNKTQMSDRCIKERRQIAFYGMVQLIIDGSKGKVYIKMFGVDDSTQKTLHHEMDYYDNILRKFPLDEAKTKISRSINTIAKKNLGGKPLLDVFIL